MAQSKLVISGNSLHLVETMPAPIGNSKFKDLKAVYNHYFALCGNSWEGLTGRLCSVTITFNRKVFFDNDQAYRAVNRWCDWEANNTRRPIQYLLFPAYHRDGFLHFHGWMVLCSNRIKNIQCAVQRMQAELRDKFGKRSVLKHCQSTIQNETVDWSAQMKQMLDYFLKESNYAPIFRQGILGYDIIKLIYLK